MSFCSLMTPAGRKLCTASTVRGHQLGIPFSELQRRAVCFMAGLCWDAPGQRRLIVIVRLKRSVWCRSGSRGTKVWTMIHWFFSRWGAAAGMEQISPARHRHQSMDLLAFKRWAAAYCSSLPLTAPLSGPDGEIEMQYCNIGHFCQQSPDFVFQFIPKVLILCCDWMKQSACLRLLE